MGEDVLHAEVVVMFHNLSSPDPTWAEQVAFLMRLRRNWRKNEYYRRIGKHRWMAWYRARKARNPELIREQNRAKRRRWYEKLKADPERYQAWLARNRVRRRRKRASE